MAIVHLRVLILGIAALFAMPSSAGPLEDATAAYKKNDFATAARLWRELAEQGDLHAQSNLGFVYANGQGVPKDYAEAVRWYLKAADQGDASAQDSLGLMYAEGWGVPQNYAEAIRWYRKAADQNRASAQYKLALMYTNGDGVVQNYVLAHFWFNLASAVQFADSRSMRNVVEGKMTPKQIAEAQALATAWSPNSGEPISAGNIDREAQSDTPEVVLTGTGFFVSKNGYLLTNYHVVEGCTTLKLHQSGVVPQLAKAVALDPNNDLVLLKSESNALSVAALSSQKRPQLGQSVVVYGFPLAGVLSSSGNLTTGAVSALTGIGDDSRLFQISAPVQPGNSGGPVMDAAGSVIGVVVSKLNARSVERVTADIPQNVNFAIKGAVVAGFLDSNGVDYATDSVNAKISVEDVAKRATRFTVLVECMK